MKAIAVQPGKPHSVHLEDVPKPSLGDIQGGKGVLVRVLNVGVDAADRCLSPPANSSPPYCNTK